MREALAPHLRVVAGRSIVALDLADGDDDLLVLRLLAAAADSPWAPGDDPVPDACVHEYGPARRWLAVEVAPAAGAAPGTAAAQLHVLDPTPLAPTVEWLARTGARPGKRGWEIRLTARRLAQFDDAWGTRPEEVRWFATSRAQRLLDGGRSVRARISVRPSGVDWFGVTAQWESEDLVLSDEDLALLRRATGKFVRLPSGWVRRETSAELDRTAEAFADLGLETGADEQRVSLWQLAQARPESLATLAEIGGEESLKAIEELRARVEAFAGLPPVKVPADVQGHAALVPEDRRRLPRLRLVAGPGRDPGRRHGPGEDHAGAGVARVAARRRIPRWGRCSWSARRRWCTTGSARPRASRRSCAWCA